MDGLHIRRDGEQVFLGHPHIFGKGAVTPRSEVVILHALGILSRLARPALLAGEEGKHRDPVSRFVSDRLPGVFDDGGKLVPHDQGIMISSAAETAVKVGVADPAGGHSAEQRVTPRFFRKRNIPMDDPAVFLEYEGFHFGTHGIII